MILVFVFTALFIIEIAAFIIISKKLASVGARKVYRCLTAVLFAAAGIITLRAAVFPPAGDIPVTGEYEIACEDHWVNEDICDPYLDDGSLRQVQVRKWYPVSCDEKRPVVVASHGSCGTIDNNISLYRELASHGYTVLAVAHPGQAAGMTCEDGRTIGPAGVFMKQVSAVQPDKDPEYAFDVYREWMDIRTADLNAVMDDCLSDDQNTEFIVMGHSLGGSAAYAMARIRNDVVGCIALESPFMYDIKGVSDGRFIFDERGYDIPLLNIYSDSGYPRLEQMQAYANNVRFLENAPGWNIYYEGVGHMGLCDLSIASPLLASLLDGRFQTADAYEQLEKMNADCLEWAESIEKR